MYTNVYIKRYQQELGPPEWEKRAGYPQGPGAGCFDPAGGPLRFLGSTEGKTRARCRHLTRAAPGLTAGKQTGEGEAAE